MIADGFEWDDEKAQTNYLKHGVPFPEALSVLVALLSKEARDPDHSEDEDRFITVGWSDNGRVLIVSHTERDGNTRIISAREVSPRERKGYENGTFPRER